MKGPREWATGISDEDIEWAYTFGQKYGIPAGTPGFGRAGGDGNKGDAARHIALGYLAARADKEGKGFGYTKSLVQLREAGLSGNTDNAMDKHNNAIGMQLAIMYEDNVKEFERALDEIMKSAKMVKEPEEVEKTPELTAVYIQPGHKLYVDGGEAAPSSLEELEEMKALRNKPIRRRNPTDTANPNRNRQPL